VTAVTITLGRRATLDRCNDTSLSVTRRHWKADHDSTSVGLRVITTARLTVPRLVSSVRTHLRHISLFFIPPLAFHIARTSLLVTRDKSRDTKRPTLFLDPQIRIPAAANWTRTCAKSSVPDPQSLITYELAWALSTIVLALPLVAIRRRNCIRNANRPTSLWSSWPRPARQIIPELAIKFADRSSPPCWSLLLSNTRDGLRKINPKDNSHSQIGMPR